jgi:uncharacterized metal-binding protein YceD (DUF177 family)
VTNIIEIVTFASLFKVLMKERSPYVVRFSGLGQGLHTFHFEAGDAFFQSFEKSEVQRGHINVTVTLEKQSVVMRLVIQCEGDVEVLCDYCAQPFYMPIKGEQTFVIKLGNEEPATDEEDVLFLPLQEHEINIAGFIYEVITLAIPLRRIHPEGTCDPEMVKSIQSYSAQPDNEENTDPRWDALKDLKNKLN